MKFISIDIRGNNADNHFNFCEKIATFVINFLKK